MLCPVPVTRLFKISIKIKGAARIFLFSMHERNKNMVSHSPRYCCCRDQLDVQLLLMKCITLSEWISLFLPSAGSARGDVIIKALRATRIYTAHIGRDAYVRAIQIMIIHMIIMQTRTTGLLKSLALRVHRACVVVAFSLAPIRHTPTPIIRNEPLEKIIVL